MQMKISFPLKTHLLRRLPFYLLTAVLLPSLVTYGVLLRTNPKEEEIFSLFIEANVQDSKALESFVRENTSLQNKEINVYSSPSSLKTYSVLFQTQGLSSDLLILSESAFQASYASHFIELNSSSPYFEESNKQVEEKHFGIELFNGETGYLTSLLEYKEKTKYYAFINKQSVHASSFQKEGKTDQILTLLEAIHHEK